MSTEKDRQKIKMGKKKLRLRREEGRKRQMDRGRQVDRQTDR